MPCLCVHPRSADSDPRCTVAGGRLVGESTVLEAMHDAAWSGGRCFPAEWSGMHPGVRLCEAIISCEVWRPLHVVGNPTAHLALLATTAYPAARRFAKSAMSRESCAARDISARALLLTSPSPILLAVRTGVRARSCLCRSRSLVWPSAPKIAHDANAARRFCPSYSRPRLFPAALHYKQRRLLEPRALKTYVAPGPTQTLFAPRRSGSRSSPPM